MHSEHHKALCSMWHTRPQLLVIFICSILFFKPWKLILNWPQVKLIVLSVNEVLWMNTIDVFIWFQYILPVDEGSVCCSWANRHNRWLKVLKTWLKPSWRLQGCSVLEMNVLQLWKDNDFFKLTSMNLQLQAQGGWTVPITQPNTVVTHVRFYKVASSLQYSFHTKSYCVPELYKNQI